MPRLRIIVDTDVLLSGLMYPLGTPGQVMQAWRRGMLSVTLSHYILNEVERVLPRLSRLKLEPPAVQDLIDSLTLFAEIVTPLAQFEDDLRDPADQQMLGTLLAAQADYLITGDKDLLVLREKYPILTPAEFWARHG